MKCKALSNHNNDTAPDADPILFNRTTNEVVNLLRYEIEIQNIKTARKKARREKAERKVILQQQIEEFVDPNQVQADCYLRPATDDDMEGVAAIYNAEVAVSYKVRDTQPVSIEQFHGLLRVCRLQNQPFIVAVEGRPNSGPDTPRGRILGVCLVDALQRGIFGSYATSTRPCGIITVIVHPEWRRKKIGTALIDVIISCCSTQYLCKGGYQWVCDPNDVTHTEPAYNARKWATLQMDVLVRSGKTKKDVQESEEYQWTLDFLEAKFNLHFVKHDQYVGRTPHRITGFDPWLDRLIFEHRCREFRT